MDYKNKREGFFFFFFLMRNGCQAWEGLILCYQQIGKKNQMQKQTIMYCHCLYCLIIIKH